MGNRTLLIMLPIAAAILLSGCVLGGVPQKDYDELKQSCVEDEQYLNSELSIEKERALSASQRLTDCASVNDALEKKLALKEGEVAKLNERDRVLAAAIEKTDEIASLDVLLKYYNDAFGLGGIANTYRLNRIDEQVRSLSSQELTFAWANVRNCQSSSQCDSARAGFVGVINASQARLANDVVNLIKAVNSTS